jgi:hypothetical protein
MDRATPKWKQHLEIDAAEATRGSVPPLYDPEKPLSISWKTYSEGAQQLRNYLRTTQTPLSEADLPPEIRHALNERGLEIDTNEDWRIRQIVNQVAKQLEGRGQQAYPWPSGENANLADNVYGSARMQMNTGRDRRGRDIA